MLLELFLLKITLSIVSTRPHHYKWDSKNGRFRSFSFESTIRSVRKVWLKSLTLLFECSRAEKSALFIGQKFLEYREEIEMKVFKKKDMTLLRSPGIAWLVFRVDKSGEGLALRNRARLNR